MNGDGRETDIRVRLSDEAYAGWKAVAERDGLTTAGLLEMLGRRLAARRSAAQPPTARRRAGHLTSSR